MKNPNQSPPTPVPAATVILVRQKNDRLQVYLLKRSTKSGFMAGKYVFPGGMVDPEDLDIDSWVNNVDLDTVKLSRQLGQDLSYRQILPYCVATIRETFEEAGVMLTADDPQLNNTLEQLRSLRADKRLPQDWLRQNVISRGGILSVSSLSCWSHWITPKLMKRRFDTRFFIAEMPAGQACRPDNEETTDGIWVTPAEGLAGNLDGKIPLSPPTLVTLHELLKFPGMDDLEAETARRSWEAPIMPRLMPAADGAIILEPWDPVYSQEEAVISPEFMANKTLSVGEPFSRLWQDEDIWRPVSSDDNAG
ncbi:MAG: hypothetical protein U9Q05_05175 [Thermodesulfobacteriota bacterium]|nr:hypothetical protein [Thermodesulfobacteriota bacterium]